MSQQGWLGAPEEDLPPAPDELPPLPGSRRATLIAEAAAAEAAAVAAAAAAQHAKTLGAALADRDKKKYDVTSRFRK